MSTSRIKSVLDTAATLDLIETNFQVLEQEIYTFRPSDENGSPTTDLGPPTAGTFEQDDVWRDAAGALWRCTAAGSPGSWTQVHAPVADVTSLSPGPFGMLVVGCDGLLYRSDGAAWQPMTLATAGGSVSGDLSCGGSLDVVGTVTGEAYYVGSDQVLGARVTGWTAPTGTADRTAFDTESASVTDLARRLKALIDDLFSHGLIGS